MSQSNVPNGRIPVLALKNTVLFPGLSQVVKVGRERSVQALKFAGKNGFWIVAVLQTHGEQPPEAKDIADVGTLCRIDSMRGSSENGYQVVLRGFNRTRLEDIQVDPNLGLSAEVRHLEDQDDMNEPTSRSLLDGLKSLTLETLKLVPTQTENLAELVRSVHDLSYLTSLCAGNLDITLSEKQKLLEMLSVRDRALHLLIKLKEFKEGLELQTEIREKLGQKLGQAQRQTILREQLRTIREELGDASEDASENSLEKKIKTLNLPDAVRKQALSEWNRMQDMGTQSPEHHIIRNYLQFLTDLPWQTMTDEERTKIRETISVQKARDILNADHAGLTQVKKRILEQLALMKLQNKEQGSILLFVGPPGVGKTSLGESIAKALDRPFVRVSLGGVRDEAEMRGHRRTYVGALPGRILQGMKKAGKNNPVFLLDEIDKLSRGYGGDPAAALLEILDPEQNTQFTDHYLDLPFDLSNVVFICTANQLDTIPAPLLDRMEVIEVSGYTIAEKLEIAQKHLIPALLKKINIAESRFEIATEAVVRLIQNYTREGGVRELQRKLSALIRACGERLLAGNNVKIESVHLLELLGPERHQMTVADTTAMPGFATGMSWSPSGGDILFIESSSMPGQGKLLLTGQLGEVMKESAQIAQSLLRSQGLKWGIAANLNQIDLHVHVPAGAIPKDGPSAGVTLVTSLVSLLLKRPVAPGLAMTGEVTLRGMVLPVGGIKEKVIAAHRAGVTKILLPARNKPDLSEIPGEVLQSVQIQFVDSIEQVLTEALGPLQSAIKAVEVAGSLEPLEADLNPQTIS